MLSHTTLGVNDLRRARRFYDAVLGALGLVLKFSDDTWVGWKQTEAERPLFLITKPFDGKRASSGNGQMIALLAPNRTVVDKCHQLALAHEGVDEGAPALRPDYHPNYYGAYFRDPDGNKLCVVYHGPE